MSGRVQFLRMAKKFSRTAKKWAWWWLAYVASLVTSLEGLLLALDAWIDVRKSDGLAGPWGSLLTGMALFVLPAFIAFLTRGKRADVARWLRLGAIAGTLISLGLALFGWALVPLFVLAGSVGGWAVVLFGIPAYFAYLERLRGRRAGGSEAGESTSLERSDP